MITSTVELEARCAISEEDARAVYARKVARLLGRPAAPLAPAPAAPIIPLHRGFIEPVQEREFLVITTRPGEPPQERTAWATCSLEVVIATIRRLEREGAGRVRVEVRAL
jgi:hypothetical protein